MHIILLLIGAGSSMSLFPDRGSSVGQFIPVLSCSGLALPGQWANLGAVTMRTIILGLAAASISACSTTQREEVRAGRDNVVKQEAQLEAAKRDGTMNEVQEERKDLREARRELRKDQNELYQPGSDGSSAGGLQIGQRESGDLFPVPVVST